jgi:FkbM family methyltransferase
MKIFLDIGAHQGGTLAIIRHPRYKFDRIYCFEPVKENHIHLNRLRDNNEKIILNKFGFLSETCERRLYNPGSTGASIFVEKPVGKIINRIEICKFIKASDWFRDNLKKEDEVFAKINIEGAEVEVLNDLLDSGEYHKLKKVMLTFDVMKVPGKGYLREQMIDRFSKEGVTNYSVVRDLKDECKDLPEKHKMPKVYDKWVGI